MLLILKLYRYTKVQALKLDGLKKKKKKKKNTTVKLSQFCKQALFSIILTLRPEIGSAKAGCVKSNLPKAYLIFHRSSCNMSSSAILLELRFCFSNAVSC